MNTLPYPIGQPIITQQTLHIHLFGPPTVIWIKNSLSIPRRMVRALLYRLASETEPLTRANLQLLFWPDVSESLARRNLSHLLTHLRRALPCPEVLVASGDEVHLDADQSWCDLIEFRSVLRNAKPDNSSLQRIIELYRGLFLEGFCLPGRAEFEQWCLFERISLEQSYLQVLEILVESSTERGDTKEAIKYAQLYLKTDSLSEAMHQRLIRLYACSGERHRAVRQFETCSTILETALGVKPLPETEIIFQEFVADWQKDRIPATKLELYDHLDKQVPITGRENEIDRLNQIFQILRNHQGQVVFISGEAGIGKSRLIQYEAKIHRDKARILQGYGQTGQQTIPYQPLLTILRSILGLEEIKIGRQASQSMKKRSFPDFIDPVWLSEISRLLPEIQTVYSDIPDPLPLEPESALTRLFDAICYLLLAYSLANGPILICLDDLQWMDSATKAWVIHIGHFIAHGDYPIFILCAYRSENADQVLEMRHALARAGILVEINLPGLDGDSLLKIYRFLAGQHPGDEELVAQLHHATGGNPFYFIETIRKLIEEGRLEGQLQAPIKINLPDSICEAIESRLNHLSPIARQVLEAGAVLGQSFGIDLLRLTSGRSHSELLATLQELEARTLLVEAHDEYCFVHEILRQHVEQNMSQLRKQLLHRRAARVYRYLLPDAFPILAHHLEAGGDLHRALDYHEQASDQAEMLFAWKVAEFHLGRMLEILAEIDPGYRQSELIQKRGRILSRRANILYLQDRLAERDDDLQALCFLCDISEDEALHFLAIFTRLRYLVLDGDYLQAISTAESGLNLIAANPNLFRPTEQINQVQARLLAQIAFAYYFLGEPLEALGFLEEAGSLIQEVTDPEAHGRIQHFLGYVCSHMEDHRRALACQQIAYKYHAECNNCNLMAWDLIDIGSAYGKLNNWKQAERFIQEGLELSTRVGSQRATAYALTKLGRLDLMRGEYEVALVHFQQVLEMQHAVHYGYIISEAEAGIGIALNHLGDYAYSRHWMERALQRSQASGLCRWSAEIWIRLGILDMLEGKLDLAWQHLEHGMSLARDCSSGECLAAGLAAQARLERLSGNLVGSYEVGIEASRIAHQISHTSCEMWTEIELGMTFMAKSDLCSALEYSQCAVRLADYAGQDWIGQEEIFMAHARILRALNQGKEACSQEEHARQEIQAKANLISDQVLREMYLSKSHSI